MTFFTVMLSKILQTIYRDQERNHNFLRQYYPKIISQLQQLEHQAGPRLTEAYTLCELPKETFLLKCGHISQQVWIMVDGVAREFAMEGDKCRVSHFFIPGDFIADYGSSLNHRPSSIYIQLLSPARIVRIAWDTIHSLEKHYSMIIAIERLVVNALDEERKLHADCLQYMLACEYYHYLIERIPVIGQLVPLNDIAAYLGISQSTLSRIRSQHPAS